MNENSASTEQNLPVSVAGNAGQDLPVKAARPTNSPARTDQSGSGRDTGPSAAGVASSAQSVSSTGDSSQWPSTSPLRSVERAHDLMSLHAFRLRDSGADSLQVVIKPGPGLQMSLHLQMRDGNVEMRAILHRGDYDFLNREWSQLQQQLEPRGVRLAPLVAGEQSANGGNSLSQEPGRRETEEDTAPAGAFPEFALAGALKPATAVKTKSLSGWESWA